MHTAVIIAQIIVALGLLNVWLLRFNRATSYRGGEAKNMTQEFVAYGLPVWSTYVVGALKVGSALCLIAGIWLQFLVLPAALVILFLMIAALVMHAKIHDPLIKSLPAFIMLALCLVISLGTGTPR